MSAQPTNTMGRYELRRVLGRGSQGRVYLGFDPELQRNVAIKIITSEKAEFNLTGANGTPLEALVSSRIKHPHIVPIHDIGHGDLGPYLVFGYVEGKTLAVELSSRQKYSVADAVLLMGTILDAVATAHDANVLHLDLGPRNIMLDGEGKPQIMDFGLAQFANFEREDLGLATGTLRYMAPEHFLRQELGPYTDVFALASTFYEMLTGRRAIPGENIDAIQRNIVNVAVAYEPINELPHAEHLLRFFKGAFVCDYEQRYADAGKMRDAFKLMVTAAGLADDARSDDLSHSTVDFLLRRMQHKKDFPAISSTLTDINRLAGDQASASADKLANVILRDLSLTSKLLKMANSSFYGSRATEVASVSQAVVLLGVQQIRMVASSLTLFGHLKGDSQTLRDSMTKSFLSGLIARHLAKREKMRDAEEAFIAGLCQNLGENLVIYYFSEEHDAIESVRGERSLTRAAAANEVLGVSYAQLGAAVARIWSLPQSIVDAIEGVAEGALSAPADSDEKIRNLSVLANELCNVFASGPDADTTQSLDMLCQRFAGSTTLSPVYVFKLFDAAFEKLKQFAPVFEINVSESIFCSTVIDWLDQRRRELEAEGALGEPAPAKAAASR
ncbi:MAG: HDOD domain-containing protein [Pseudomonadota bacterium]